MTNSIAAQMSDSPYLRRRILTYADVIRRKFPAVEVTARGKAYSDLIFRNPDDAITCTQQVLDPLIIECTIVEWIKLQFTEANNLQEYASSFFSFSTKGNNQIQISMYEQKHAKSKSYLYDIQLAMSDGKTLDDAIAAVEVPAMLKEECALTEDRPYDLARAIIQNYLNSNEAMTSYFGKIEGERRLAKRRLAACQSIADLKNVKWAEWPEFVPPVENIGD